jgi:hypothetical protein
MDIRSEFSEEPISPSEWPPSPPAASPAAPHTPRTPRRRVRHHTTRDERIFHGLEFKAFAARFPYILSISYVVPRIAVYKLQLDVFLGNLVLAHTC